MRHITEPCPRCGTGITLSVNLHDPTEHDELRRRAGQRCTCNEVADR